ncbi:alpha/beta-hydrolase [Astrocystis sublimbata]|nr:alpha/beta-hydrolase [Astrocystis sublimbata]
MHVIPALFSLAAVASASKALHYTVPNNFKALASNCTLPADFVVSNLTTFTDAKSNSTNTVSFTFSDPDTEIHTTCQRNATSIPSGPGKNKYACDSDGVSFIYQTTGIAGLTVIERACARSGTAKFEASGLVRPELDCTDNATGTLCRAKEDSVKALAAGAGAFTSPDILPKRSDTSGGISFDLFASLERLSRLVDITYCVGTTGIRQPFSCISRCKDFPSLELVTTWNTGALLSDSCGYVAIDHGPPSSASRGDEQADNETNGAIIVAFRGTYSITNTVIDLSTVPQKYVPYPPADDDGQTPRAPKHVCTNCTVHMGFLLSWQLARLTVLPELKRLHAKYPNYPVHVVGHSLGGAVGALAALEMKVILGWENIIVTTFGEPRVGNAGFTRYLDTVFGLDDVESDPEQRTYRRITHVDDPVPLLPLAEWGYRSHAGEFFISRPDLSPRPSDIWPCAGDYDPKCISGSDGEETEMFQKAIAGERFDSAYAMASEQPVWHLLPAHLRLWELLFAHRDYFWRLGLCIPGGDPIDWWRDRSQATDNEL